MSNLDAGFKVCSMPHVNEDALGYDPIGGGGINNQKMAVLGLLLEAAEQKKKVILPRFRVMDQVTKSFEPRGFEDVYELAPIKAFCSRYDIDIVEGQYNQLPQGYDKYFWKAYGAI